MRGRTRLMASGAHGSETIRIEHVHLDHLDHLVQTWMGNENPWDVLGCHNHFLCLLLLVIGLCLLLDLLACCQPQGHTLILVEAYRQSLRIHEVEESGLVAEERLAVNIDKE